MTTVLSCDSAVHEKLLRHRAEALDVGNEYGAGPLAAFARALSEGGCQTRNLGDEHKFGVILYHGGDVCLLEVQLVQTPASKEGMSTTTRDGAAKTTARHAEATTVAANGNAPSANSAGAIPLDTEPFPGYRDLDPYRSP